MTTRAKHIVPSGVAVLGMPFGDCTAAGEVFGT
jgi:hypothetical protein